jgi:hypothetical protein
MPFVILPTNSASGGYDVTNSLRFNFGSSDYLTRTPSTSGNRKTFTISVWLKRSLLSSGYPSIISNNNNGFGFDFSDTNFIRLAIGTSSDAYFYTTQLFRDPSAWYHLVAVVDTTDATSTDRMKLYVNGTRITSFSTSVYPSQNLDTNMNTSGIANQVGANTPYSSYFSGYMSEFYLIDGQALTPSSFGETDFDTGIWKPKAYTGTYGTNGFYLQFKNSSSLGTDSSGNGNTFTVNNLTSVDQTTDTPTNNFCTLNPLDATASTTNLFTQGNTEMIGNNSTNRRYGSTFAVSKGKWYCEFKQAGSVSSGGACAGIFDINATTTQSTTFLGLDSNALQIQLQSGSGNVRIYNGSFTTDNYGSSASIGDIIMIALDMDNYFMYVGQNGTWLNSGVPTSGASGTGKINVGTNINYSLSGKTLMFGGGVQNTDYQQWNFGNPSYSANSYQDANGFGNFSYSVPSGYYALCTKNLYQYGF